MKHLIIIWLVWNVITFFMMGIDKWKARHDKQRISEKTLLLSSLFMGAIGGGAGMLVFHHKTRKKKFQILIPIFLVLNFLIIAGITYIIVQ